MPREGWESVGVPTEMRDKIKKIVEENPDKFRSINDFVSKAILAYSEYSPRFTHINYYDDHVTIRDREIERHLVDVYFSHREPYILCEHCESSDCDHVKFTLTLPEVIKTLKKKGFVIDEDEGRVVRGPPDDCS